MEVYRKSMVAAPSNVIYLSSILGQDGPSPVHKCDWKCENEHVCGNRFRCKLTGLTHICDKNCNQRILYDNHNSLCLASRQIFPLTPTEEQAVRGIRRKLDAKNSSSITVVVSVDATHNFILLLLRGLSLPSVLSAAKSEMAWIRTRYLLI